jgi:hypothetical protein
MAVRKRFLFYVFPVLFLYLSSAAMAADVSLAWDPSPSSNISGYKLYMGNASGNYGAPITIGNQTTYRVADLVAGTWYFAVTAFDVEGNESDFSNEVSHTVVPAVVDTTPPTIRGVSDSNGTRSSVIIHWTTNENSDSQIEYGTTTSYGLITVLDGSMGTSHSQEITGLSESTLYHYRVRSRDAAGNLAISGHYTFATAGAEDNTPPTINKVASSYITGTGATISWETNEASDTQVEYGSTINYENSTAVIGSLVRSHSQRITGLHPNTLYHYRVKSRDSFGNLAVSRDYVFATGVSGSAPVISNIEVSDITHQSARISWITDKASNSRIEYWSAEEDERLSEVDLFATSHSIALNNLKKHTLYVFRVSSTDLDGNQSASAQYTFTTLENGRFVAALPRFSEGQEGVRPGDGTTVGIALTNFGEAKAEVTYTALASDGMLVSGEDIDNPGNLLLNPMQQHARFDTEIFGFGLERSAPKGWIEVTSNGSEVGGFYSIFDSKLSHMDAASLGVSPLTNLILPEIEANGYTLMDIVNSNPEAVEARIDLMSADGAVRGSFTHLIDGRGALVAELFRDLFGGIEPQASDYVRISSSNGLHAFQLMQKDAGDNYSMDGLDMSTGNTVLYSPHYVQGGFYQTALSLINLESRAGTVELRFVGDDGAQIGATRVAAIPANGKLHIDDPKFFGNLELEVLTSGYVKVNSGVKLTGSTVVRDRNGTSFAAALPLVSGPQKSVLCGHVVSNDLFYTKLVMVNPNRRDARATIQLYSANGLLSESTTLNLQEGQREERLLTEIFPTLNGQNLTSGYVRIFADRPLASLAVYGKSDLSILSAIPLQIMEFSQQQIRSRSARDTIPDLRGTPRLREIPDIK